MIGGNHPDSMEVKDPSSKDRDLFRCLKKRLSGESSKGTDDFGLNDLNLLQKERAAGGNLFRFWVPVLRRPAFDDIGDVDLFTFEANGLEDLRQKLPGLSYEGSTLNIFFISRALANQHQDCLLIPFSEDKGSSRSVKFAASTVPHL